MGFGGTRLLESCSSARMSCSSGSSTDSWTPESPDGVSRSSCPPWGWSSRGRLGREIAEVLGSFTPPCRALGGDDVSLEWFGRTELPSHNKVMERGARCSCVVWMNPMTWGGVVPVCPGGPGDLLGRGDPPARPRLFLLGAPLWGSPFIRVSAAVVAGGTHSGGLRGERVGSGRSHPGAAALGCSVPIPAGRRETRGYRLRVGRHRGSRERGGSVGGGCPGRGLAAAGAQGGAGPVEP